MSKKIVRLIAVVLGAGVLWLGCGISAHAAVNADPTSENAFVTAASPPACEAFAARR